MGCISEACVPTWGWSGGTQTLESEIISFSRYLPAVKPRENLCTSLVFHTHNLKMLLVSFRDGYATLQPQTAFFLSFQHIEHFSPQGLCTCCSLCLELSVLSSFSYFKIQLKSYLLSWAFPDPLASPVLLYPIIPFVLFPAFTAPELASFIDIFCCC